ncbi:MAG TPA: hypothetical protein VK843_02880 [Planctomycetota bacterium]|nr:hypothetical protein [Planctomycetota bacterium]
MVFHLHKHDLQARAARLVAALVLGSAAFAQEDEPKLRVDLLDNGSGAELSDAPEGDERRMLLPWWASSGAARAVPPTGRAVELAPGAMLSQPIAAYAPLASLLTIEGRVHGSARISLIDASGTRMKQVDDAQFELTASPILGSASVSPLPRFTLELAAALSSSGAGVHDLHAWVSLPCPSEAALAAELRELCDGVFRTWLERGVDRDGSRQTAFLTTRFDAVTGKTQPGRSPNGINPFYESLLEATSVVDDEFWRSSLEVFLGDFLELGFHPATGLPREWDGELDLPQDAKPIEVARYLSFLLDVSERGPEEFRARALEQAERMAASILARGRLPDGSIAVKFVPADGRPDLNIPSIRQLDVAAQLARLARKNGDARLADAARSALAQMEYVHYLGGTWSSIDPDFDDSYGNWGSKATTMLAAFPEDPVFRRFTQQGVAHFAPMWRDALRFGGSIAADQVRCWRFLLLHTQIDPSLKPTLDPLLRAAVRAHFKGEQYESGAWGDVTFAGFSPRAGLNVGDFPGAPANLFEGLAAMYRPGSALRTDETRAMFTAVLRSSKERYGRKFGWLRTREESKQSNPAEMEVRMVIGATEMLKNLSQ